MLGRIIGFRLVTRDPDRLARFYAALGFEADEARAIDPAELALLGVEGRGVRRPMRIGTARVDLDRFDPPGEPYPAGTDAASRCFQHLALVTDDAGRAWRQAAAAGAVPIGGEDPVTLPPSSGGVTAIKFRDPEGHPLEFIRFPDAARRGWAGEGLLGIDHSALVAADLASSQAFYTKLGLSPGAATVNRGSEQDRLDGLDGACADVVPMMPREAHPHVELLHYRTPAGAPSPPWSITDVAATRIVWKGDIPAVLRDPDGHIHQIER